MIRITIDREVIFKGQLMHWVEQPPDIFREAIKPGAQPKPWMKGILVAMGDAVRTQESTTIDVRTFDNGWSMKVTLT